MSQPPPIPTLPAPHREPSPRWIAVRKWAEGGVAAGAVLAAGGIAWCLWGGSTTLMTSVTEQRAGTASVGYTFAGELDLNNAAFGAVLIGVTMLVASAVVLVRAKK